MPRVLSYEPDAKEFKGAYRLARSPGVAWHVLGWEMEPTEDTEWDGIMVYTGKVVAVMVGDDTRHVVDREDLTPLKRSDYCGGCGQIGCKCDAYEEDD